MAAPLLRPASLARSTLIQMGVRIGILIALTTLASYLHMFHTLREDAVQQLARHVAERSQREEAIFLLARDNHALLVKALEERIRVWSQQDPDPRFDSLFTPWPDGTVRSRVEGFDGLRMVGLFVPPGVKLDTELRRRILAAHDVITQYGPSFSVRFTDTYITLVEGPVLTFWPERPRWALDLPADDPTLEYELFTITTPEKSPRRQTVWTGSYLYSPTQSWLVTASTPLDMEGRHVASFSHDIWLDQLMDRSINDHLPGTYNLLVRDDGQLIAHPALDMRGATMGYDILGTASQAGGIPPRLASEAERAHLRSLFEKVRNRQPGEDILELPEYGEYLAVARLRGPGWNFVTVLPKSMVTASAWRSARYVLLLGLASLLLELVIMYLVLQRQIARPLRVLTEATHRVASGDFQVALDASREDELGQLAGAFRRMADKVQQREEQLRQANEGLEHRVEERTRELKTVHGQLVQTARQAGMAEIATNVLHNVGNVLNSVYTSSQLARSRVGELRLEHVSRVATLLDENQTDLQRFITEDERGRNVLPFMSKLGQNLLRERQEICTLLEDVGRYTEHIGDIVKVQQNHARTPRMSEPVLLASLVDDALRINAAALTRHQVKEVRQLSFLPPVMTDKHKVLMILVNLISNAKYAMDGTPSERRILTVTLERPVPDRVRIAVQDHGMGISQELLTRIFQYGFTTRKEGHGFGLHSSAVAAQELGGSLTVHSDGPGRGATFTLELPYQPIGEPAPLPPG
ncbi:sensor histidine kinase [Archangium violaceum]|uniref:histidine kinase n=1 Tax=Archangium violaceum Cb vi76 TaxID=1406225 RepID=A0A084T234_9BACT|nr:ATP-binding protein [Archangium violaceum]KFA94769.1 histidine kinase [Archangium violaceum Cb vi76]